MSTSFLLSLRTFQFVINFTQSLLKRFIRGFLAGESLDSATINLSLDPKTTLSIDQKLTKSHTASLSHVLRSLSLLRGLFSPDLASRSLARIKYARSLEDSTRSCLSSRSRHDCLVPG